MCGRYTITKPKKDIEKRFDAHFEKGEHKVTYNAAPSHLLPIITSQETQLIQKFRWGLIPGWASDESFAFKTINARVETITEKPAFKYAFQQQRCLVIADSYYEWKTAGGDKVPYRITLKDDSLFSMAGLWERWDKGEEIIYSFTIITLPAITDLAPLHHRMPAILSPEQEQLWLYEKTSKDALLELIQVPNTHDFRFYTVSKKVNSVRNNRPDLIEPFDQAIQGSLF